MIYSEMTLHSFLFIVLPVLALLGQARPISSDVQPTRLDLTSEIVARLPGFFEGALKQSIFSSHRFDAATIKKGLKTGSVAVGLHGRQDYGGDGTDGINNAGGSIFSLPPGGITLTFVQTLSPTSTSTRPTFSPAPTTFHPVSSSGDANPSDGGSETDEPSESATDGNISETGTRTSSDTEPTSTDESDEPSATTVTSPSKGSGGGDGDDEGDGGGDSNSKSGSEGSSSNNGESNSSNSNPSNQPLSSTLIAVIVVLSVLATLSLLVGLFIFLRQKKRRQSLQRLPDLEDDPNNNSRTPLRAPELAVTNYSSRSSGMREIDLADRNTGSALPTSVQPRNPFEDVTPATTPFIPEFDLEFPKDSTLVKKRINNSVSMQDSLWVSRRISRPVRPTDGIAQ